MTFTQVKMAIYATYLTNTFGFKLKRAKSDTQRKQLRDQYASKMLGRLNIHLNIENPERLPLEGQYLFIVNHRSIIDPTVCELMNIPSSIFSHWVSKKELYNSFFFGLFVRNAGTVLLDRDSSSMGSFFADIKSKVAKGDSIYMFPEGTRNKTDQDLLPFKAGSRLIALKNRLPIFPIYIKTPSNELLMNAILNPKERHEMTIVLGEVIDYKTKTDLEVLYREQFGLPPKVETAE